MASIADLYGKLLLNDQGFEKAVVTSAGKAADKAGATMGQRLGASIKKSWTGQELGKGLVQGLGLAGGLGAVGFLTKGLDVLTDGIGSSIQAASDLEQSVGGVEAVFGPAAAKVQAFGDTAAKALGLSKNAVNEMATVIGAKLQGMGLAVDEAADKTLLLEQRGADMAATFGGTTKEAVEAISSLLSGERDPIEKYGVSLKDADIKARILSKGLDTSTTAAEKNAVAVASLELLLEQTAKTTGRFAAETTSAAGSQQILNAELENEKAMLGEELLPLQKDWTQLQRDAVPVLGDVVHGVKEGAKGLGYLTDTIADQIDFMTPWDGQFNRVPDMMFKVDRGSRKAAGGVNEMGDSLADVADRGDRAAAKLVTGAQRIGNAYRTLTVDLLAQARSVVDGYYSVLITKDQLAATNAEIAAQRRIIASSTATAAEKEDARSALHQLERDQARYLQDLAEAGATSGGAFTSAMEDLLKRLKTAHGSERKAILAEIEALKLLTFQAFATNAALAFGKAGAAVLAAFDRRASGGPVYAGTPYTVGERGSETFIPAVDGWIAPHRAMAVPSMAFHPSSGGTGGGGVPPVDGGFHQTNNITVTAPTARETPMEIAQQARRFAKFGGPAPHRRAY